MSAFLSKVFDVGDLPVPTIGMSTNDRGDQVVFETTHIRFLTYVFSKIQKNMNFYVFCCTRFLEH